MNQGIPGRSVGRLKPHGEGTKTTRAGAFESKAIFEKIPIQMEAYIGLKTFWEAF